jgi:hypothetical protein
LFLLHGVTSGVIAQAAPAKAPELKVIATPDQIASHPSVIGATIPNTAIIGRDGKVVTVFRGAIDRAILKKQLDSLIARSHTRG